MTRTATFKTCVECGAEFKVRAGAAGATVRCIPCRRPAPAPAEAPRREFLCPVPTCRKPVVLAEGIAPTARARHEACGCAR